MMFSVCFDFHNQMFYTQSLEHNNILNPKIKCFMLDYKYTEPSIKGSSFRSKNKSNSSDG